MEGESMDFQCLGITVLIATRKKCGRPFLAFETDPGSRERRAILGVPLMDSFVTCSYIWRTWVQKGKIKGQYHLMCSIVPLPVNCRNNRILFLFFWDFISLKDSISEFSDDIFFSYFRLHKVKVFSSLKKQCELLTISFKYWTVACVLCWFKWFISINLQWFADQVVWLFFLLLHACSVSVIESIEDRDSQATSMFEWWSAVAGFL